MLNDEWCAFFKRAQLPGRYVSIDGPRAMHDAYRVEQGRPGPTFDRVLARPRTCSQHSTGSIGTSLCTVHAANADHGRWRSYRFFRDELEPAVHPVHPDRGAAVCRWRSATGDRSPSRSVRPGRAVRPLPDRGVRGVGPPRRWQCVRADVRHGAGGDRSASRPRSASTGRRAGWRLPWSTPGTCTPVTTSWSPGIGSGTSRPRRSRSWSPRRNSGDSGRRSAARCHGTAGSARCGSPVMAGARRTDWPERRTASPA